MQTSLVQIGLISVLSMALGISLSSSVADGYPAGATVSTGSNPIVNASGHRETTGWDTVISATAEHDLVVTDLVFSADHSGAGAPKLRLSTGQEVGQLYVFGGSYHSGGPVHLKMETGIRVPAGEFLEMDTETGNAIRWTLSGYLAQP